MELDWIEKAACRGTDPEVFAALPGTRDESLALSICAGCPVRLECLDEALATADETTIRGGYTPSERRELMRDRLQINA